MHILGYTDKAGGVPQYTVAFANYLKDNKLFATQDNGTLTLKGIHELNYSNTLLVPVIERIDALSEDAKRLIKICSCFTTDSFARSDLTVAKSFLTSPSDECLNEALNELSGCLMIVRCGGGRTSAESEGRSNKGESTSDITVYPLPAADVTTHPLPTPSTIIAVAAATGDLKTLKAAEKSILSEIDDVGNTSLVWASDQGQVETVAFLIQAGVDPNIRGYRGNTALARAARHGHAACVKLLLSTTTIDVNGSNDQQQSPLHYAASCNGHECVQAMINSGKCDFNVKDRLNRIPAEITNDTKIHAMLSSAPATKFELVGKQCGQHTLKFSQLILNEASNNLMLESQRKAVHAKIAKHFSAFLDENRNSASCNDLERRAIHHMRAGHKETASTLLCSAAIVAYKSNHRVKATDLLLEAMDHEKNNINKAYMLGLLGWVRVHGKHRFFHCID